jgi:hypothetical protein
MAAGWTAGHVTAGEVRGELSRRRKEEKVEAAKQEAEGLLKGLMAATREERAALVEAPEYWNWALAVRVCEHSVKRAAHRAEEALDLAHLALVIAERVPGEESWRRRLMGYCWAHVANARRVANNLAGSDEAFVRAWEHWRAGAGSDPISSPSGSSSRSKLLSAKSNSGFRPLWSCSIEPWQPMEIRR